MVNGEMVEWLNGEMVKLYNGDKKYVKNRNSTDRQFFTGQENTM